MKGRIKELQESAEQTRAGLLGATAKPRRRRGRAPARPRHVAEA
jgi:hypothetical protein